MRKIMLASPVKGGAPMAYVAAVLDILKIKLPDTQFGYSFHEGASVNCARNELVDMFLRDNYDTIVFSDVDMRWTPANLLRLISHKELFVASIYCRREKGVSWLFTGLKDEEVRPNGLLKVHETALGFCKIERQAFESIRITSPDYECAVTCEEDGHNRPMFEFFPMGLEGPNSQNGRLFQMREYLASLEKGGANQLYRKDIIKELKTRLTDRSDIPSRFIGEDYYFCKHLRNAGIDVLLDTHLIIPHTGRFDYPIPTTELMNMLSEPWRKDDIEAIKQARMEEKAKQSTPPVL